MSAAYSGNAEGKMKNQGITLIEMVVVLSVAGALTAALVFDYRDWTKRYSVESTTKELYMDLMHARMTAMSRSREYYVILGEESYSIVEDTNDNEAYDSGDTPLPAYPKKVARKLDWNNKYAVSRISFDGRGLITGLRTIWVTPTADAEFSCIRVSTARIIMGKYIEADNDCKVK
jgi:prepilin-type N-terminal cleavage/methylation domain-containing protein